MMGRYRGRHRAGDSPNDIPTKPFPPIDTPVRRNVVPDVQEVFVVQQEGQEIHTWVFEGAAVPPYIGTHIAMHCNLCHHVAWTYRNTDEGWRLLRERIDEHTCVRES